MSFKNLINEAVRIDNKNIMPNFESKDLKAFREAKTEYLNIQDLFDLDDMKLTEDGIYSLMDSLELGSVGIADEKGNPVLNFIKNGSEVLAHNMYTDEDDVIDYSAESLEEYIKDQLNFEELNESLNNYAIALIKDAGNENVPVRFIEGYSSLRDAQDALIAMEELGEFPADPTLDVFIVYSDGMSWFAADTGEEIGLDFNSVQEASKNEDYTVDNAIEVLEDEIEALKLILDKVKKRVYYRMKDNVSYTGDDAIERVSKVSDEIKNFANNLHEYVFSNLIG